MPLKISKVLAKLRKSRIITQEYLGNKSEKSRREISFIETGKKSISSKILMNYIKVLSDIKPFSNEEWIKIISALIKDTLDIFHEAVKNSQIVNLKRIESTTDDGYEDSFQLAQDLLATVQCKIINKNNIYKENIKNKIDLIKDIVNQKTL